MSVTAYPPPDVATPPSRAAGRGCSLSSRSWVFLTHHQLGVSLGLLLQGLVVKPAGGGRESTGGDSGSHGCGSVMGFGLAGGGDGVVAERRVFDCVVGVRSRVDDVWIRFVSDGA